MSGQDIQLRLVIGADGSAAVSVLKQTGGEVDKLTGAQKANATATTKSAEAHDGLNSQLSSLKSRVAGALSIVALTDALISGGKAVFDTTAKFERYTRALGFASGSQAGASAEMDFARRTAQQLGLQLDGTVGGYARLSTASQGTALQGKAMRDVFVGISQAAAVVGLNGEQMSGILNAVSQMVSKGTVMSEELRQQMAEHLPGAFNIAARAMGKTTAELSHMLEQGQLATVDFLPKFAAELTKTFGPGSVESAKSLTGAVNSLSTAITTLQLKAGESGAATIMAEGINSLTKAINAIPEEKFARLVNAYRNVRAEGYGALLTPVLAASAFDGYNQGDRASQGQLSGLQSDIRDRLRTLPAYAGTADQNKILDEAKASLRELMALIEARAVTTESASKRMLEAEGKLLEALKKTSEQENKAAARRAEPKGYYSSTDERLALIERQKPLIEKFQAPDLKVFREYEKAIATLTEAKKEGTITSLQYAEAEHELSRTTQIAYNTSRLALERADIELAKERADSAIKLNKEALATQSADLKASLDNQFVNKLDFANRSYELTLRGIALDKLADEASLKAIQDERAQWTNLIGQYLTINEARAENAKFDQREEEAKNRIAINVAKLGAEEIKWRQESYAAARAEFDQLNKIDESRIGYLQTLKEQNDEWQLQLSLIGKTETDQKIIVSQAQIRKALQVQLNALIAQENALRESGSLTADQSAQFAKARQEAIDAAKAQADLSGEIIRQSDALNAAKGFWDGFFQSIKGGWKGVRDYIKNFFFDWLLKQLSQQFTMNVLVSGSGGVSGVAGAASNAFGLTGPGGLLSAGLGTLGTLGGVIGMGGSGILGAVGAGYSLGAAGMTGAGLAGAGGAFGLATGAGGLAGIAGGIGSVIGSVIAAIPVVGWIALAAATLYGIFGKDRQPGFKIDNNLTSVGNPSSHFTANPISAYDFSGRGTDDPRVQESLKPLKTFLSTVDGLLANNLLGADTLAKIRANINKVNNDSSWQNLDAAGIEKGTKEFLIKRYGAIFDEVDAKLAASIRGFTGTSDELMKFIAGTVGVMQTLQTNALLFKQVIGETVSLGQLSALSKAGESLADTLTRVIGTFTLTSQIAEIMGKGADAFGEIGLASMEARERLVTLAGGLQSLSTGVSFYFDKFFTEEERLALRRKQAQAAVDEGFATLGLAVPTSREAFKALVQGLDLTTKAGQEMLVALLKLAPSLDTLLDVVLAKADAAVARVNRYGQLIDDKTPDRFGASAGGRSSGSGVVAAAALLSPSNDFLNQLLNDEQRRVYRQAENARKLNDAFALLDVAVPKTRDQYIRLALAQDQTTARGRQVYQVMMDLAGVFAEVTAKATAASQHVESLFDRSRGSGGPGAVTAAPTSSASAEFLNMMTDAQRAAYQLAQNTRILAQSFALVDVAIPDTAQGYIALANAQDLNTARGRQVYDMLMANAGAFLALHQAGKETAVSGPTDSYLANYFTQSQQAAYKYAQAQRQVTTAFEAAGVAAPKTRAEFVAMVNAQDQTTEAGRLMVAMLMKIEPAFTLITAATETVIAAVTSMSYQVGDLFAIGSSKAQDAWKQITGVIDAGSQSLSVKLIEKFNQAGALAARFDATSQGFAPGDDAHRIAYEAARDEMLQIRAGLAGNIALLATVTAQYGSAFAEQMYDLELWHQQQIDAATGNASLLLLIEQTYATRRNAILTGGIATGLNSLSSQLRAWLDKLLLNSQLSTLTPAQRLAESQRQYNTAITGTDANAITSAADAYLKEARDFYASGDAYSAIFAGVIAAITARTNAPVVITGTATGGSATVGSAAAVTASNVATAAAVTAVAAADATTAAVNQAKDIIADLMAQTKNAVIDQAQTTRAADAVNTQRVVEAVNPRSVIRVL